MEPKPPRTGWHRWWLSVTIGITAMAVNVLMYFLLPPEFLEPLKGFGYVTAFAVAAFANASVLLPVPYYPLIARLAQALNVWGVILAAAAGSALGESVAFFVGKTGRGVIEASRVSNWIQRQMRQPWRAGIVLFALSAPPNPAFDIAGLLAGAFGVPLRVFLISVFLGRIIRMSLVAFVGLSIEWV